MNIEFCQPYPMCALLHPVGFSDQFLSSWTQHGGDGAYATSEPGLTGRAQGGPTGPHESIQGTTKYVYNMMWCWCFYHFDSNQLKSCLEFAEKLYDEVKQQFEHHLLM